MWNNKPQVVEITMGYSTDFNALSRGRKNSGSKVEKDFRGIGKYAGFWMSSKIKK